MSSRHCLVGTTLQMICHATVCFLSMLKVPSAKQPTHTVSQPARHPPQPTGRLGVAAMAPAVQRYFQEGLAASTCRTYNAAMKRFHSFCSLFDIHSPFPVTEHLLCSFAAHLPKQGLAPQTIKGYLAAVRKVFLIPESSLPCQF